MSNMTQIIHRNKVQDFVSNMMNECIEDMLNIGIPVQKDRIQHICLTKLNNTQAGCSFKKINDGKFVFIIVLHEEVMEHIDDEIAIANVKDSIYHELLHTCPNAQSHNEEWIKWAVKCDNELGAHTRVFKEREIFYNIFKGKPFIYKCSCCGFEYHGTEDISDNSDCEICGIDMENITEMIRI